MKKRPLDRVIERKQKVFVRGGVVQEINSDGTVTVEYGGTVKRLLNMSPSVLYIGVPVTVTQLYGSPDMAFISGLSPQLAGTSRTIWL